MLKRVIVLIACAAALTACGQGAPSQTETAEVRVSDVPCGQPGWGEEVDASGATTEVYFEQLYAGDETEGPIGISIGGPAGSTCTGSAKDGETLTCVMQGPVFALTVQDTVQYVIPEGRTATLTHTAAESTCFLNEEG